MMHSALPQAQWKRLRLRLKCFPRKETAVKLSSVLRFLRARRTFWTVVEELSNYSDRELHDIGIERAYPRNRPPGLARTAVTL